MLLKQPAPTTSLSSGLVQEALRRQPLLPSWHLLKQSGYGIRLGNGVVHAMKGATYTDTMTRHIPSTANTPVRWTSHMHDA